MRWDTSHILVLALECGFAAAMLVSAALDIRARRLPNALNLAVALGFLPWAWASGLPWSDFALHLAVGAAVLGLGFGLFAFGVIGGGDAKLGAAVALWIGLSFDLLRFFLVMALAGGVLAMVALAWQARTRRRLTQALPYGVAIGAAGLDYWLHHSQAACFMSGC
jgi:prepilin peptidase CpaA